jgi:hypothetical protein
VELKHIRSSEMMNYEKGQPIWVSGMNRDGGYSKQGRKAIFSRYIDNDLCIVILADVRFRKQGLDSYGITCLLSNISVREVI